MKKRVGDDLGLQFVHHLAKVALVSQLALLEEELRIHETWLPSAKRCYACHLPTHHTRTLALEVCPSQECKYVTRCAGPDCVGRTHLCHVCKVRAACYDTRHYGRAKDNEDREVTLCGECERPVCNACVSKCLYCAGNYVCRTCSPGPYAVPTRPWAGPKPEHDPYDVFCDKHLQMEYRKWAALETCVQCALDLQTRGSLPGCQCCVPCFAKPVVCQHTQAGPGQTLCLDCRAATPTPATEYFISM